MKKSIEAGRPPYQSVSLDKRFIDDIKKSICKSGHYASIAEFVREACREKMERIYIVYGKKP